METELDPTWRFARALRQLARRRREADLRLRRLLACREQPTWGPDAAAQLAQARALVVALGQRDRLLRLRAVTEELGEGD